MAVHINGVVLLLSSSYRLKFCENLILEDNFNNTYYCKKLLLCGLRFNPPCRVLQIYCNVSKITNLF